MVIVCETEFDKFFLLFFFCVCVKGKKGWWRRRKIGGQTKSVIVIVGKCTQLSCANCLWELTFVYNTRKHL